ncbi:MAG TPA: hypothetical protein VF006_33645 [Longimicrobium sp.]
MILSFPTTQFSAGAQVTAQLTATGSVLIESDLAAASTQASPGTVSLGPARAGLFVVRYSRTGATREATLLLLPASGTNLELIAAEVKDAALGAGDRTLIQRLGEAITKARLADAAARAFPSWIAMNGGSLGANGLVCLLVVPLPALGGECAYATISSGVGLAVEFMKKLVEACVAEGVFTASEGDRLKTLLTAGNTLTEVLLSSGKLDRVLSVVTGVVEVATSSATWQLTVKYTADATKKYHFLLHVHK